MFSELCKAPEERPCAGEAAALLGALTFTPPQETEPDKFKETQCITMHLDLVKSLDGNNVSTCFNKSFQNLLSRWIFSVSSVTQLSCVSRRSWQRCHRGNSDGFVAWLLQLRVSAQWTWQWQSHPSPTSQSCRWRGAAVLRRMLHRKHHGNQMAMWP